MAQTDHLYHRDARDQIAKRLGIGSSMPVSDVRVKAKHEIAEESNAKRTVGIVAHGLTEEIHLLDSQEGVAYFLYSDKDELIDKTKVDSRNPFNDRTITLTTDAIKEDIQSYYIIAKQMHRGMKTRLRTEISVKAGIDVQIPVEVMSPVIDHNGVAQVKLLNTQERTSYQLYREDAAGRRQPHGEPVYSEQSSDIVLTSNPLKEDTELWIKGTYQITGVNNFLNTKAPIAVRPDQSVNFSLENDRLPFNGLPEVSIPKPQSTCLYQIYFERNGNLIKLSEPVQAGTEAFTINAIYGAQKDGQIRIKAIKTANREEAMLSKAIPLFIGPNPDQSFNPVQPTVGYGKEQTITLINCLKDVAYEVSNEDNNVYASATSTAENQNLPVVLPAFQEDAVLIIRATKSNGLSVQLNTRLQLNVLPNTALGITLQPLSATEGEVVIENTQRSTRYTLMATPMHREAALPVVEMATKDGNGGTLRIPTGTWEAVRYQYSVKACKKVNQQCMPLDAVIDKEVRVYDDLTTTLQQEIVTYNTPHQLLISNPQADTVYQIMDESGAPISDTFSNDGTAPLLLTTHPLKENATCTLLAVNPFTQAQAHITLPKLKVYPNTNLELSVVGAIPYNNTGTVKINNAQKSCTYQLKVSKADDVLPDHASRVHQPLSDTLPGTDGALQLVTPALTEDHEVYVEITNPETGIVVNSASTLFLPVLPDSTRTVKADTYEIPAGSTGMVIISGAQRGVVYQLRYDGNNQKIGNPVYMSKNKPVGAAIVGVSLSPSAFPGEDVYLPTPTLSANKTFNVLASKPYSKAQVMMDTKVAITIQEA